jgi:hypothetical protein
MFVRRLQILALLLFVSGLLGACGDGGQQIEGQVVEAACGLCQFRMEGRSECYWAVRIDGKEVMARGDALPSDAEHDSHGPEGMCTTPRRATVSGTLYETYFLVTDFELEPVVAGVVGTPHEHTH